MKVQYASDLHIEFPENNSFLKNNPIKPVGDILVLAGDIVPFAVLDKHLDFFKYLSDNFKNTYWIPGNHEYYGSDISQRSNCFTENILPNVQLLNNTTIEIEQVHFIFSTLWTQISETNQWYIKNNLSDFHTIKNNGKALLVNHYNELHANCIEFINKELYSKKGKTVFVSHHVPTFMNYPEKYKGDALNDAFAVELFPLIEKQQPDCWIYGHTHGNIADFTIGKTNMLTNQLGYVKYSEHKYFVNNKVFEI